MSDTAFQPETPKNGRTLKDIFTAAALSRPGQAFFDNSARISCVSFIAGNLILGTQYVVPAAGFILSDLFLAFGDFQDRKTADILPHLPVGQTTRRAIAGFAPYALRTAGVATLAATGALAYLVRNEPGSAALLTSCSFIALQAASWIFERPLHTAAKAASQSGSTFLSKIFAPLAQYPVMTMTALDLVGKTAMAYGAIQSGDMNLLAATALWAIGGDGGLICEDESVRDWFEKKKAQSTPAPS